MEAVREYILRLTAAALLFGTVTAMVKTSGTVGKLLKLLLGIFMAVLVLNPLGDIRIRKIEDFGEIFTQDAQLAVDSGKDTARQAWIQGIKASTEAYILDKAKAYDASVSVNVRVENADTPKLVGVELRGQISPYGKRMLSNVIAQELGISEEDQVWIG